MSSQSFGPKGRVFVLSLGLMLWLTACGDGNATKKVLVIGIDGIRVDILAETNTPNIDQLIAEGFFSDQALSANVRETRSTQRIRVGRRQRNRTCWDCEREWKRMVVPLEPGRPSEARQLLRTRRE